MSEHPSPELIVALARAVGPELREKVLVHIADCDHCASLLGRAAVEVLAAERARKMIAFERAGGRAPRPRPVAPRVWWTRPRSGTATLAEAEPTVDEIMAQPESQRPLLVQNTERYRTLAIGELILERARELCYDQPDKGITLAELGLAVIDRLDHEYYGQRTLDDVRGRGCSYIANAHRILNQMSRADEVFRRADELLDDSPEPLERAGLYSLWSSLYRDRQRFDPAIELLTRAIGLFEDAGEEGKAGRAFVSLGNVYAERFEPESAEGMYAEALVRIDASEDPRSLLYARHGLADSLTEQERYQEAAEILDELEPEHERHGFTDSHTQVTTQWLRGRIAAGLGRDEEAESLLQQVRKRFVELGNSLSAANVSLNLAQLFQRQRRFGELRRLAEDMTPFFFSRDLGRETVLALSFFVRAVEQERVSSLVIERVTGFMRRSQSEPDLRFSDFS